jgi:hypothetical protein
VLFTVLMRYGAAAANILQQGSNSHYDPQKSIGSRARSAIYSNQLVGSRRRTINDVGAIACRNDKWDEKEVEKGHKLVDYAGRCVNIPDDPAAPKYTEECVGKYEYMPDESWKGSGTCTDTYKGGDKVSESWEEGSHLKEYAYKVTGGTGKYQGASGGGTYTNEELTDTLLGDRYKGQIILPRCSRTIRCPA